MRLTIAAILSFLLLAAPASAAGPGAPPLERTREPAPRGGPGSTAARGGAVARAAALSAGQLKSTLRGPMRSAGGASGAAVIDLTNERPLFALRSDRLRTPASVQKLYTTSTALIRYGPSVSLETTVAGVGALEGDTWKGDLYLHGAGDPTFGSLSFTRRSHRHGG